MEVKTGDGVLTKRERSLRDAIRRRKVAWEEVRVDTSAKNTPDKKIATDESSISELYKNIDDKLSVARAGIASSLKTQDLKTAPRHTNYTMEVGAHGRVIRSPSDNDIIDAIRALNGQEDDFIIVGRSDDEDTYMQCAGGPEDFTLEYQEGSEDNHYCADVSRKLVIAALISFVSGDERWRGLCRWEHNPS